MRLALLQILPWQTFPSMFGSGSEFLLYVLLLKDVVEGRVEALLLLAEVLDCLEIGWSGTMAYDSLARGIALAAIL